MYYLNGELYEDQDIARWNCSFHGSPCDSIKVKLRKKIYIVSEVQTIIMLQFRPYYRRNSTTIETRSISRLSFHNGISFFCLCNLYENNVLKREYEDTYIQFTTYFPFHQLKTSSTATTSHIYIFRKGTLPNIKRHCQSLIDWYEIANLPNTPQPAFINKICNSIVPKYLTLGTTIWAPTWTKNKHYGKYIEIRACGKTLTKDERKCVDWKGRLSRKLGSEIVKYCLECEHLYQRMYLT